MEPEFDKEIDALLRRETVGRTITISEFGGIHLDADEITAFAEKKVPPGVRDSFIEHFAACDRCRKVLLNAAWLNAEEEQAEHAGAAAPVEIAVPWYRRLLLFPNLAYVMGGLVVLFAGFIGLSVVYNNLGGRSAQVSQVEYDQVPAASGPSVATEPAYSANSNASMSETAANSGYNSAANMANAVANAAAPYSANRAISQPPSAETSGMPAPRDEVAKQRPEPVLSAAPPPPTKNDDSRVTSADVAPRRVIQDRRPAGSEGEKENKVQAQRTTPMATPAPKAKAATGNERRDTQAAEADLSLKKVETLPTSPRGASMLATRKQVSGRTFELRQGAWYDINYRGQGTINVRRNTDAYRQLDRGLRGIAESLIGTVVTVWNGKAYRIQ